MNDETVFNKPQKITFRELLTIICATFVLGMNWVDVRDTKEKLDDVATNQTKIQSDIRVMDRDIEELEMDVSRIDARLDKE